MSFLKYSKTSNVKGQAIFKHNVWTIEIKFMQRIHKTRARSSQGGCLVVNGLITRLMCYLRRNG